MLLLPETGTDDARGTIERIAAALRSAARAERHPVTFSIGVLTLASAPDDPAAALGRADELMYEVKRRVTASSTGSWGDASLVARVGRETLWTTRRDDLAFHAARLGPADDAVPFGRSLDHGSENGASGELIAGARRPRRTSCPSAGTPSRLG